MTEVFCKNCRHYKSYWLGSEHVEECRNNPETVKTPIHKYLSYTDCEKKNKKNNCKEFVEKKRWWKRGGKKRQKIGKSASTDKFAKTVVTVRTKHMRRT